MLAARTAFLEHALLFNASSSALREKRRKAGNQCSSQTAEEREPSKSPLVAISPAFVLKAEVLPRTAPW
jgi:hypothetical protein